MQTSNIVLIGYMGSGKSTIGRQLASKLNRKLIDTDSYIEKKEGKSISEIFRLYGEEAFRDMETETILELSKQDNLIVSTGGGMPVREKNRELLKKLGTTIYLKAAAKTIYERVKHDTKRPLLQCDDPMEKIKQMLAERGPAYSETAMYSVSVDNKKAGLIADEIIELTAGKAE